MKRLLIKTLGCKVNQFESEAITAELAADGWILVEESPADLCIVNTCTVTAGAAMQSRQAVRRCRRENPAARVVMTGCQAVMDPRGEAVADSVDRVVPHRAKYRIPELVRQPDFFSSTGEVPSFVDDNDAAGIFPSYRRAACFPGGRTRPFLKIQDGCNAFCSYCIVPYTRGRSVSMPLEEVLLQVRNYAAAGCREVVLTGIHLGAYGLDLSGSPSLFELLRRLEKESEKIRIRLSSIEPLEVSDEIIDLAAGSGFICDHFHIPLQSGCDSVLKRMGRPYRASFFAGRVESIKKKLPAAAVGVDLLVGFPGEDEAAAEATRALIDSLPVSYLHVFPFSPRPGTPAWRFSDQVPESVKKQRCRLLRELGHRKKEAFALARIGSTAELRIEEQRDGDSGCLRGVTSNYLTVLLDGPDDLKGCTVAVTISGVLTGLRVRGELRQADEQV